MNAGVGPVGLPAIEICLRCLQTLEALSFKWCLLRMAHPGFNFAFAIRIFDPTGQSDCAIVGQQIAIERIEFWIVDIRLQDTFTQIVEHDDTHTATQSTKGSLM